MKILALDTTTRVCSVAVIDNESILAELTRLNRRSHSQHLIDLIDTVCRMSNLKVGQVDGFAVSIGPGSFTGLRIGINAIKGLAYMLNKPVVAVSSLDALAWQCAQRACLICPLLDARKKEVYTCRYRFKNNDLLKIGSERLTSPVAALVGIHEPCIFVGNGAQLYREKIAAELGDMAHIAAWGQHSIRASSVAFLSLNGFNSHKTIDVALLVPRYIRKPDAVVKGAIEKVIG